MKNISLYILMLACMLSMNSLSAQQKEYKGTMSVNPLQLEQVGDSLLIAIDFDIRGVNVDSRRSISLIPTLVAPNNEKKLPEVMVKGRANYLTSQREVALMSKPERNLYEQNIPYAIVKGYKNDSQKKILYRKSIPFEPWMKDASLNIQEDLCGCGNQPRSLAVSQLVNRVQLEPIILPYEISVYLAYVQPEAEAVKKREMVGEAFLDFQVSKINILPEYMNNPRELKRITEMMEEVHKDEAITVKNISVIGYASPEGTLEFNEYLSEGRAKALVDYLRPKFDYPENMYSVEFGGENWKGLLETVNGSQMKYKEQVLSILTNETIDDQTRKDQLKKLLDGEPYRYMRKEYFPSLRKAICKIDYEIKGFEVVEAKEMLKTQPQNLSLNEMYLVANTYKPGSNEFIDLFETAVRLYPQDQTAILNAASAALSRKDTVLAERYLNRVKIRARIPEYDNAKGVLEMLKANYDIAEEHLKSAADAGLESAKQNLLEVKKKLENINKINKKQK